MTKDLLTLLPEINPNQIPMLIQWIEDEIIQADEPRIVDEGELILQWRNELRAEQRQRLHDLLGVKTSKLYVSNAKGKS